MELTLRVRTYVLIMSCIGFCFEAQFIISFCVCLFFFPVEVAECDTKSLHFTLRDPSFTILNNGSVVAVSPVKVPARGRTFSVMAQDNSGLESEMEVHLVHSTIEREVRLYTVYMYN